MALARDRPRLLARHTQPAGRAATAALDRCGAALSTLLELSALSTLVSMLQEGAPVGAQVGAHQGAQKARIGMAVKAAVLRCSALRRRNSSCKSSRRSCAGGGASSSSLVRM